MKLDLRNTLWEIRFILEKDSFVCINLQILSFIFTPRSTQEIIIVIEDN